MDRDRVNKLIEIAARHDAICDVLDGNDPGEFMLSFPEVREVADLKAASQPIAPADGEKCCGCEYLGKCEDDPQKADYCPLRR